MFTPCNAKPISLGPAPWNEICPKKYPSPGIPVVQLWQTTCNKNFSIPLGFYCSKKRFSKSSTKSVLVELFYVYLCGAPREIPWRHLVPQIRFANCWT